MLRFPAIKVTTPGPIYRQRSPKGLSPWFPGADTLDIMPMIVEVDEPSERPCSRDKRFNGKLKRRNTAVRQRETGTSRMTTRTPIMRSVRKLTPRDNKSVADNKCTLSQTRHKKTHSETFNFAKFVKSLDKITLPKLDRPSSNSSLISKYSNTSSANTSSSYARSEASTITIRDIDGISLEPEDSISRAGVQDTSVMDLDDDDMADLSDDIPFALTPPLRFGATLSKEASMAMLMEYEDTLKQSTEPRLGASSPMITSSNLSVLRPSHRYDHINQYQRDSPTESGYIQTEQRLNQRQVNKKMHRAMSLLDRVKQIEHENIARNSPISCYTPRGISPNKCTRNW